MASVDKTTDANFNLCWGVGDSDKKVITIKQNGAAVDLTGQTFRCALNSELNPTDTANQVFDNIAAFDTDGTDGKVLVGPDAGDLDGIEPGVYFWELSRQTPDEKVLIKATATILQVVSKV